jgi:hypothetical protein
MVNDNESVSHVELGMKMRRRGMNGGDKTNKSKGKFKVLLLLKKVDR